MLLLFPTKFLPAARLLPEAQKGSCVAASEDRHLSMRLPGWIISYPFLAVCSGQNDSTSLSVSGLSWEVGRMEPTTPGVWERASFEIHAKLWDWGGGQVALSAPACTLSFLASSFLL